MGLLNPMWRIFGAERNDHKQQHSLDLRNQGVNQILTGRIDPMCVLEDDQDRFALAQALELSHEHRERPILLRLRRKPKRCGPQHG